jgi:antirestriction protein ArdC
MDSPTSAPAAAHGAAPGRSFDLYAEITRQITDMLQKGVVPWRSPILGQGKLGLPKNLHTGLNYRGVNVFTLAVVAYLRGFPSAHWLTYRQAL